MQDLTPLPLRDPIAFALPLLTMRREVWQLSMFHFLCTMIHGTSTSIVEETVIVEQPAQVACRS